MSAENSSLVVYPSVATTQAGICMYSRSKSLLSENVTSNHVIVPYTLILLVFQYLLSERSHTYNRPLHSIFIYLFRLPVASNLFEIFYSMYGNYVKKSNLNIILCSQRGDGYIVMGFRYSSTPVF